ncbi:MAG TPA: hypothetical protein PK467_07255 [Candidatus Wallbacteria bacterium]|nr:hypothetical protein [Candidatus Wallbacteria bacterium]
MNSRSNIYLKEAVSSIQKGHLTLEDAALKYGIAPQEIGKAIKNYCLHGDINGSESALAKIYNAIKEKLSIKSLFYKIAPTYDCEKEIDRFKFKFAYAMGSLLLVALGTAAINFPAFFAPADSTAKTNFEEKLDRTLMTSSKRPKSVDAEIKYLNNFYSRINKILDENNSKDSKMLRDEVKKRLKYINAIEKDELVEKAANFTDIDIKGGQSKSAEIYSNLYTAASHKDKNNYMAKTLKERIDNNYLTGRPKTFTAARNEVAAAAVNVSGAATASRGLRRQNGPDAEEMKPLIESPVKTEQDEKEIAEIVAEETEVKSLQTAEKAPAPTAKSHTQSYKFKKAQGKNYESLKDKLYIINKYKRETMLKKALAKRDLKFKYPVADLIFVPDRAKYNESLKKIATNKDYGSNKVMITEDRG